MSGEYLLLGTVDPVPRPSPDVVRSAATADTDIADAHAPALSWPSLPLRPATWEPPPMGLHDCATLESGIAKSRCPRTTDSGGSGRPIPEPPLSRATRRGCPDASRVEAAGAAD